VWGHNECGWEEVQFGAPTSPYYKHSIYKCPHEYLKTAPPDEAECLGADCGGYFLHLTKKKEVPTPIKDNVTKTELLQENPPTGGGPAGGRYTRSRKLRIR
jgi:hypothetical protein